jgi:hypothetical protein
MTDLKKLRELAMTCENDPVDFDNALEIFNSYANPKTILKLLDEVEAARKLNDYTVEKDAGYLEAHDGYDKLWNKYQKIRKQNEGDL